MVNTFKFEFLEIFNTTNIEDITYKVVTDFPFNLFMSLV